MATMFGEREHVDAGGLMSYGGKRPGPVPARRRLSLTGSCAGAKPGDLPVEQPTKFDLIINLKSAKALRPGHSPKSFLAARRRGDRMTGYVAAVHKSGPDAVDGSSTGT